ncbi:hypothetical protein [Chamaesiphon sp. VAR_69_metabat_338]|uniref:hypothetical protein n=1 Tax=Chamaesiphon sp. VAR_69_metabat_338 TaxID=2964704 RepID=UPI00286E337F|nr:hypothetical protein [Chamaesiphon sp. VAR_69_metabat_338]
MRKLRTLEEATKGYFRDHPEEIDDYLTEIFQDFAEDNDTRILLSSLRVLARDRVEQVPQENTCNLPGYPG